MAVSVVSIEAQREVKTVQFLCKNKKCEYGCEEICLPVKTNCNGKRCVISGKRMMLSRIKKERIKKNGEVFY